MESALPAGGFRAFRVSLGGRKHSGDRSTEIGREESSKNVENGSLNRFGYGVRQGKIAYLIPARRVSRLESAA